MKRLIMFVLMFLALAQAAFAVSVTIGGITPNQGRANDTITFTGLNVLLSIGTPKVFFGTYQASCTGLNNLLTIGIVSGPVTCTVPTGPAPGTTVGVKMVDTVLGVNIDISDSKNFTYLPNPPTISGISPSAGVASTLVTITGTNLAGASATFDGTAAVCPTVTATQMVCLAPTHADGAVDLVVSTTGGSATTTFNYATPPTITSVSPPTGPASTSVIITGTSLTGGTAKFDGITATCPTVTATQMICTAPAHQDGLVSLTVTTLGGTASSVYTYIPAMPLISGINPSSGVGGTEVTITGTNLTGSAVTFDGLPALCPTVTATSVTCNAPAHLDGNVSVVLTTPGGSATTSFSYSTPAPTVTGINPTSGTSNSVVTISGTNLLGASVTFDGTAAVCPTVTATQITCTTPAHVDGNVPVVVTTQGGSVSTSFTYSTPVNAPTITAIAPSSGVENTTVTITGTNLAGAGVTFDGVSAVCPTVTATLITCSAPAHADGNVSVVVSTPGGNATGSFLYSTPVPAPTVTGISPATGMASTVVTITGTNLTGGVVTFDGIPAACPTVSATQISCSAPAHLDGSVPVVVTTAGGSASTSFVYDTSVPLALPTITAISPTSGPAGTAVVITGTNLAGASVTFDGAIVSCPGTGTQLNCTAPAHADGTVSVVVSTPAGSVSISFTFRAALGAAEMRAAAGSDTESKAISSAQLTSAKRVIRTQMANFSSRLGQVKNVTENRDSFKLALGVKENQGQNLYAYNTNGLEDVLAACNDGCQPFSSAPRQMEMSDVAKTFMPYTEENKDKPYALWTGGAVHFGSEKYVGDLDYTTVGVSAGMDKLWTDSLVAGFGVGYTHDKTDATSNSTLSSDAYAAVLYGTYAFTQALYLEGMVGYSYLTMDSERYTTLGKAYGTRAADQVFGSLSAGYIYTPGAWRLTPRARMEAAYTGLKPYAEHGADILNLKYERSDIKMFALSAGMDAGYEFKQTWGSWIPKLSAEYLHNFEGNSNMRLGYADTSSTSSVFSGTAYSKDNITLGAGVDVGVKSWTFFAGYALTKGDNSIDNRLALQAGYQF